MKIKYNKYINKPYNRMEFWLINWDYIDGNDYLAKLFSEEYGFVAEKKIDGWWYSIIRIYCLNQTEEENNILQYRLERILDILNARIEKAARQ